MDKQKQIDALSDENVRMSALLQRIADVLPTMQEDLRDSGKMTGSYIIDRWLDALKRMGITPNDEDES